MSAKLQRLQIASQIASQICEAHRACGEVHARVLVEGILDGVRDYLIALYGPQGAFNIMQAAVDDIGERAAANLKPPVFHQKQGE